MYLADTMWQGRAWHGLGGQAALDAPSPPFSMLRIVDLLPEELRAAYRETGADAV